MGAREGGKGVGVGVDVSERGVVMGEGEGERERGVGLDSVIADEVMGLELEKGIGSRILAKEVSLPSAIGRVSVPSISAHISPPCLARS